MKPPEMLLNLEDLGESSDDSDFRIEDHCLDGSDSSDGSVDSNSSEGTKFIEYYIRRCFHFLIQSLNFL